MIRNTAGQKIGAQLVSATDGSAFTGSVTVYVTGDAGSQAAGSVGSGACTHEGNGYHTYAPDQAETNYDLIAFTFVGTGAVPATVQVFTKAGDAFTRLGAPAGASVSADIAAVKSDTAAILADTGTDGVVVSATSVRTAVGLAAADLDTQLAALPTAAENADAVWDEVRSGHTTAGTFGEVSTPADVADQVWDELLAGHATGGSAGAALSAAGTAGDPWSTALPGAYGAGTAGKFVSDMATGTTGVALRNGAHGGAAAVLTLKQIAVTNSDGGASAVALVANGAGGTGLLVSGTAADITGDLNGAVGSVTAGVTLGANAVSAAALAADAVAEIADGVWDEVLAGHAGAGTAGSALGTASTGGVDAGVLADAIWDEDLSGHATAGTAGAKLTTSASGGGAVKRIPA